MIDMQTRNVFSKQYIQILFIVLAGLLSYSNTFDVPFHFDDNPNIVSNPAIRDFKYFWNIEDSELRNIFYKSTLADLFKTRIVGFFTFALNYKLHEFYLAGYHVINLFIHIMSGILVYLLMLFTLRTPYFNGVFSGGRFYGELLAILPALLFISHPIQTQAVTYIVQRFASLATMFYLMSIVFYVKFRLQQEDGIKCRSDKAKAIILYVISILSAILGMKTKEIVFTLPVMIIAYEYMFLNGQKSRRFLNIIPFVLTMLIIPVTLIEVNAIGDAVSIASSKDIRWWEYLFTQFRVIITYVRLLFLPINQNLDYDYPVYRTFWDFAVTCSFMFHIAAIGLAFYLYKKSRQAGREQLKLIAFGIIWFYVTLSVESSIIPIADVIFEHRLYLPSVGFFMGISGLIVFGADKARVSNKVLVSLMVAVVIALSIATYKRNNVWRDEITLWEDVAKKSPNKARVYYGLGEIYASSGNMDKALDKFRTTLSLNPRFLDAYNSIGIIYFKQGLFDKAISAHETALSINPEFPKSRFNLGNIYSQLGRIKDAIQQYEAVLKTDPYYEGIYINLANLYIQDGLVNDALITYENLLKLRPDLIYIYLTIGDLYKKKGDMESSLSAYNRLLKIDPNFLAAYKKIGEAYEHKGQIKEAIRFYEIVYKRNPKFFEVKEKLETLYKEIKRVEK